MLLHCLSQRLLFVLSVVESLTPARAQLTSTTCITCQDFEPVHAAGKRNPGGDSTTELTGWLYVYLTGRQTDNVLPLHAMLHNQNSRIIIQESVVESFPSGQSYQLVPEPYKSRPHQSVFLRLCFHASLKTILNEEILLRQTLHPMVCVSLLTA